MIEWVKRCVLQTTVRKDDEWLLLDFLAFCDDHKIAVFGGIPHATHKWQIGDTHLNGRERLEMLRKERLAAEQELQAKSARKQKMDAKRDFKCQESRCTKAYTARASLVSHYKKFHANAQFPIIYGTVSPVITTVTNNGDYDECNFGS